MYYISNFILHLHNNCFNIYAYYMFNSKLKHYENNI